MKLLNQVLCLVLLIVSGSLKASSENDDECSSLLREAIGISFQSYLEEELKALSSFVSPKVLVVAGGMGVEALFIALHLKRLNLLHVQLHSLEIEPNENDSARRMHQSLRDSISSNSTFYDGDASLRESYDQLSDEYSIVVLRHPNVLEGYQRFLDYGMSPEQIMWQRIIELALLRTAKRDGVLWMTFYSMSELEMAIEHLKRYSFADQLSWSHMNSVPSWYSEDSKILRVNWKQ